MIIIFTFQSALCGILKDSFVVTTIHLAEQRPRKADFVTDDLMEAYRPYLMAIANQELDSHVRPKVGASDIVQESLLEAHKAMQTFHGSSLCELKEWLRQILRHNLANNYRAYQQTSKRQLDREVPLDDSSQRPLRNQISDGKDSPLSNACLHEELRQLQSSLLELPPNLRQLIVWHNLEQETFPQIALRLGRSVKSVQKQWVRAICELKTRMTLRPSS